MTPAEIDAEDIEDLKLELPKMRELANGSLSREQFFQQEGEEAVLLNEESFMNFYVIFRTIGIFTTVLGLIG